jgi:hypothetical protein
MPQFLTPDDVDRLLKLPEGKAARLARRGLLPAIILPDKSIRFEEERLRVFLEGLAATRGKPGMQAVHGGREPIPSA